MKNQTSKFHRAARIYAERFGLKVFPIIPREKRPLTRNGVKDATKNLTQIDEWWTKWPNANIGIAAGLDSGIIVLDFDQPIIESIASFEGEFGKLPNTPQVITGKKGIHFYFACDISVKNYVGFRPHVDIRSDGGYVIAPPSLHPNGTEYMWDFGFRIGDIALTKIPKNIVEVLCKEASYTLAKPAVEWGKLVSSPIAEGTRNATLCSLAGHLFRRHVDPYVTRELIHCWNVAKCKPPLNQEEVRFTLNSIAKREIERRKSGGSCGRN